MLLNCKSTITSRRALLRQTTVLCPCSIVRSALWRLSQPRIEQAGNAPRHPPGNLLLHCCHCKSDHIKPSHHSPSLTLPQSTLHAPPSLGLATVTRKCRIKSRGYGERVRTVTGYTVPACLKRLSGYCHSYSLSVH